MPASQGAHVRPDKIWLDNVRICLKNFARLFLHARKNFFQNVGYRNPRTSTCFGGANKVNVAHNHADASFIGVARWVACFVHQIMGLTTTCVFLAFSSCWISKYVPKAKKVHDEQPLDALGHILALS